MAPAGLALVPALAARGTARGGLAAADAALRATALVGAPNPPHHASRMRWHLMWHLGGRPARRLPLWLCQPVSGPSCSPVEG